MDRHADRAATLASLRARWGSAAPRPATEVFGALAAAPLPAEAGAVPALPGNPLRRSRPTLVPVPGSAPEGPTTVFLPGGATPVSLPAGAQPSPAGRPLPGEPVRVASGAIPSGFPELDALLAAGGLPRAGTVALRGAGTSGATTLALRAVAEAQAGGALVAWVDLSRSLDPVEAVARGVRLEWLAVLVPASLEEALAMAGGLLQARAVDVLVLDLAARGRITARTQAAPTIAPTVAVARPAAPRPARSPRPADRLARLVAFARRAGALLLVLEPAEMPTPLRGVLGEGSDLRLDLRRAGWIRLGREVVGQRTEVRVAKDRHGAPDRRTLLRLLYAEGGPRDRCLARGELLAEEPVAPGILRPAPSCPHLSHEPERSTDAPPPPLLAPPRPPARAAARALAPGWRAADHRRAAMG